MTTLEHQLANLPVRGKHDALVHRDPLIARIASGGVGTIDQIYDAFVCGADACLAASIVHYETYTVDEIKEYLRGRGMG